MLVRINLQGSTAHSIDKLLDLDGVALSLEKITVTGKGDVFKTMDLTKGKEEIILVLSSANNLIKLAWVVALELMEHQVGGQLSLCGCISAVET